jgi:hypothetical protein
VITIEKRKQKNGIFSLNLGRQERFLQYPAIMKSIILRSAIVYLFCLVHPLPGRSHLTRSGVKHSITA